MITTAIVVSVLVSAVTFAILVVLGKKLLRDRVESIESRFEEVEARTRESKDRATADRTAWEQRNQAFQERLGSFGSRQADLEGHLKKTTNAWQQGMADVEGKLQSVESSCDERVHVAISDMGTRLTTFREEMDGQLAGFGERLEGLETQTTSLRADLDLAQEGVKDIGQRVAELESARRNMQQRLAGVERDIEEKMRGLSQSIERQNDRLDELRHYLQDVFQRDLHGAMESFDRTVTSVLGEMKEELLEGVERIERIESAVAGRRQLGDRLVAGSEEARQLIDAGNEGKTPAEQAPDVEESDADPEGPDDDAS